MPTDRDAAAVLLGAIAEEIADRVADLLAPQLAELAETGTTASERPVKAGERDDGLWSAGRVAAHYDVAVRFVYRHAEQLGCIRLGGGQRPRLRFDPEVVRQRWAEIDAALPAVQKPRRRSTPRERRGASGGRRNLELLRFNREQ